jgi:hypothetical protein
LERGLAKAEGVDAADRWFTVAARHGNTFAMLHLAGIRERVATRWAAVLTQDRLEWLNTAAREGNTEATELVRAAMLLRPDLFRERPLPR